MAMEEEWGLIYLPVLVLSASLNFRSKTHSSLDCWDTLGFRRFGICRTDGAYSGVENSLSLSKLLLFINGCRKIYVIWVRHETSAGFGMGSRWCSLLFAWKEARWLYSICLQNTVWGEVYVKCRWSSFLWQWKSSFFEFCTFTGEIQHAGRRTEPKRTELHQPDFFFVAKIKLLRLLVAVRAVFAVLEVWCLWFLLAVFWSMSCILLQSLLFHRRCFILKRLILGIMNIRPIITPLWPDWGRFSEKSTFLRPLGSFTSTFNPINWAHPEKGMSALVNCQWIYKE